MNDGFRFPKIVETAHYHIWTDALHARALAHQSHNKWDRGTYVRWAITTSWTVLEMACEDALKEKGIGKSFRKNLDAAVINRDLSQIEWGMGVWQQISKLHTTRKALVHINPAQAALFPNADDADKAIDVVRNAMRDIYLRAGIGSPPWVEDDLDRGWDKDRESIGHLTVTRPGVDPNSPCAIRVGYVYKNKEYIREELPAGTDPQPIIADLLRSISIPISHVRVYEGQTLIVNYEVPMRGT